MDMANYSTNPNNLSSHAPQGKLERERPESPGGGENGEETGEQLDSGG